MMSTNNKNIASLEKRLSDIVDISYEILCSKIASLNLTIPNEASFQLQFGVILKQVGQLYEFENNDRFSIQLEEVQTINATQKSKNGKARCDIMLFLNNGRNSASVAIELKCFKKSNNETVTDNRFSILCDIENLENYKMLNANQIGYEVVYTDNTNYTNPHSTSYIKIGDGATIQKGEHSSHGRIVNLTNSYIFNWDIYRNDNCFLKLKV